MQRASVRRWASVAASAVAVALLGGVGPVLVWVGPLAAVACVAAPWLRRRLPHLPRAPGVWLAMGAPAVATALGQVDLASGAALALAGLVVLGQLTRSGPSDDRAHSVLTLLILTLVATSSSGPIFLLGALVWAITTPMIAVLGLQESLPVRRRHTVSAVRLAGLGLAVVLLATAVFLLLPRVRPSTLGTDRPDGRALVALTGFSDHVRLGDVGALLDSNDVVFRASVHGLESDHGPLYFRGLALDRFDGDGWSSAATVRSVRNPGAVLRAPQTPGSVRLHITQEPLPEAVLFTLGEVHQIAVDPPGARVDDDGNWRMVGQARRLHYVVDTTPFSLGSPPSEHDRRRWTALPVTLPGGFKRKARGITAAASTDRERLDALVAHLRTANAYTRRPGVDSADLSLLSFVLDERSGHCEFFASALAVMLREVDVPTRLVNGFVGGELNEVGDYLIVRQSHAHSWVEAWIEGEGWVLSDATPGADSTHAPISAVAEALDMLWLSWYRSVLDYDLAMQVDVVRTASWGLQGAVTGVSTQGRTDVPWLGVGLLSTSMLLLVLLGLRALAAAVRRLAGEAPRRPDGRLARVHALARRRLASDGWRIPASLPPVEAGRWLRGRAGEHAQALEALAWLHYRVRYGGEAEGPLMDEARALASAVRALGPPRPVQGDG